MTLHCDRRETTGFQEIVPVVALPISGGALALQISSASLGKLKSYVKVAIYLGSKLDSNNVPCPFL